MEGGRGTFPLMCLMLALLVVSQGFVALSESLEVFGEQKNYYSPGPDPHVVSPPSHTSPDPHVVSPPSHTSRPRHSHRTPTINCPPPPRNTDPGCPPCGGHGTPTPSHGGGGHGAPSPSHGGGSGGYYNSPPPLVPITPPSPTLTPITPTPPFTPITPSTPTTPFGPTTPLTPIVSTPPSPPFLPVDPNSPPFYPGIIPGTPIYWNMNPGFVWGIFGYWATIGGLFGPATVTPFGRNLSVQEALSNPRADGIGELYRQGTAALLNSMVNKKFPLSTEQVRRGFASAVASEKMAASQAKLFKLANEGRLKKGNQP